MRWVVVVGVAVGLVACARLNPNFGEEGDAETDGMGGGSADDSGSGSTGLPPIGYECNADQSNIRVIPPPPECTASGDDDVLPVTIEGECVAVHVNDEGAVVGSLATGCGTDQCNALNDIPTIRISAEYTDMAVALELDSKAECRLIWAHGFPIRDDADGRCWWDGLVVQASNSDLQLAVGNGLPDDGFPGMLVGPGADGIPISSTIIEPTSCGTPVDSCPRQGWRALEFGVMNEPVLPDGVPVPVSWNSQEFTAVNHGLQFDRSCERFGRWGLVRQGYESAFLE